MTIFHVLSPETLGAARGYSHGLVATGPGRLLFVAGQTAADADGQVGEATFESQFDAALRKVLAVVASAGGRAEHVGSMTIYVTDMDAYRASRAALAPVWSRHMGRHYPAIALVEVRRLVDTGATVEIQAMALLP